MFIIGFFGGLASQMNQFSFMTELQRRFPETVIKAAIADKWLNAGQHNGYELNNVFGIEVEEADIAIVKKLSDFYPAQGMVGYIGNKFRGLRRKIYGKKKHK